MYYILWVQDQFSHPSFFTNTHLVSSLRSYIFYDIYIFVKYIITMNMPVLIFRFRTVIVDNGGRHFLLIHNLFLLAVSLFLMTVNIFLLTILCSHFKYNYFFPVESFLWLWEYSMFEVQHRNILLILNIL